MVCSVLYGVGSVKVIFIRRTKGDDSCNLPCTDRTERDWVRTAGILLLVEGGSVCSQENQTSCERPWRSDRHLIHVQHQHDVSSIRRTTRYYHHASQLLQKRKKLAL